MFASLNIILVSAATSVGLSEGSRLGDCKDKLISWEEPNLPEEARGCTVSLPLLERCDVCIRLTLRFKPTTFKSSNMLR